MHRFCIMHFCVWMLSYFSLTTLILIFILQMKMPRTQTSDRWWSRYELSLLLTATWTALIRAGVSERSLLLFLSITSRGNPEYKQWEKGRGWKNREMGALVVQGSAGSWPFPDPGLLASQYQSAKYLEPSFKMYFYSFTIPYIWKNIR